MYRATSGLAILVIGLVIWVVTLPAVIPEPPTTANGADAGDKPPNLLADLAIEIDTKAPFTFESLQPQFDRFSWDTFVAINRPVGFDRSLNGKKIGDDPDNLAIWELWKEDYEIFLEKGKEPAEWGAERQPPSHFSEKCKQMFVEKQKERRAVGRPLTVLEAFVEPFDSGPLIDQNGRYARFEILVNEVMFGYIHTNELYSKAGQEKDRENVVFPCGDKKKGKQGSIMIKAAWKVLTEDEKKNGGFHTADCLIYTRACAERKIEEKCEFRTMGLVGFHIVHKTQSRPQWIWSTFEHKDNCPTLGDSDLTRKYNFFSNDQHPLLLAPNSPPPPPWDPTVIEPLSRRSQIKRMLPVTPKVKKLNKLFQDALGNSVWKNYQLISTQWPSSRQLEGCDPQQTAPVDIIAFPAPQFLGNSTLESYVPGEVVNVSSSCIECHANATMTNGRFSDFTYLLLRAK
jgi:hypothetical protein